MQAFSAAAWRSLVMSASVYFCCCLRGLPTDFLPGATGFVFSDVIVSRDATQSKISLRRHPTALSPSFTLRGALPFFSSLHHEAVERPVMSFLSGSLIILSVFRVSILITPLHVFHREW
jgi:hypothetical protein